MWEVKYIFSRTSGTANAFEAAAEVENATIDKKRPKNTTETQNKCNHGMEKHATERIRRKKTSNVPR